MREAGHCPTARRRGRGPTSPGGQTPHRPDPEGGDGWWVERDNPKEGLDSWAAGVGAIPAACIRARVLLRVPERLRMWVPAGLR